MAEEKLVDGIEIESWLKRVIYRQFIAFYPIKPIETERRIYALVDQSSLVQIMACLLDGTKPLSEKVLEYF